MAEPDLMAEASESRTGNMSCQNAWGGCIHAAHSAAKRSSQSVERSTFDTWKGMVG